MSSKPILLALEFVNGGSLRDYLMKDNTKNLLNKADLLQVVISIGKACAYLEEEGYIH